MTIPILTHRSYGRCPLEQVYRICNIPVPDGIQSRTGAIIDRLRDVAVPTDNPELTAVLSDKGTFLPFLNKYPDKIIAIDPEKTSFLIKSDSALHQICIEDVDTTRQWTIDEYDGYESILYPCIKIVDKDLNYCEITSK